MLPPLYPHATKTAVRSHLTALGIPEVPSELLDAAAEYINDGLPFPSEKSAAETGPADDSIEVHRLSEKAISREEVRGFLADLGYTSDDVDCDTLEAFVAAVNEIEGYSDDDIDVTSYSEDISLADSSRRSISSDFNSPFEDTSISTSQSAIENDYSKHDESVLNLNLSSSNLSSLSLEIDYTPEKEKKIGSLAASLADLKLSSKKEKQKQRDCYVSDAAIQCTLLDESQNNGRVFYYEKPPKVEKSAEKVVCGRRVKEQSKKDLFRRFIRNPEEADKIFASLENLEYLDKSDCESSRIMNASLDETKLSDAAIKPRKKNPSYYSATNYPKSKKPVDVLERYLNILRHSAGELSKPSVTKRPTRTGQFVEKPSARDPVRRYQQYRQVWAASAFLKRQKTKSAPAIHGPLPL